MNTDLFRKAAAIVPMLLATSLNAQTDSARTPYERVQVVKMDDSRTADQLFASVRNWFMDGFKYARGSTLMEDPVQHTITGKGTMRLVWEGSTKAGTISYTVAVTTKPGRYRVRFYDLRHSGTGSVRGKSFLPPFDLGRICSGAVCYDPGAVRSNAMREAKKLARVKNECADVILPQIEAQLDSLSQGLELQMRKAASATNNNDW